MESGSLLLDVLESEWVADTGRIAAMLHAGVMSRQNKEAASVPASAPAVLL